MAFTQNTALYCDDTPPIECYYPSTEYANWLNTQNEQIANYQTGILLSLIFQATLIFFLVAFFIYSLTRK
jgi:hypothetical protein